MKGGMKSVLNIQDVNLQNGAGQDDLSAPSLIHRSKG